MNEQKFLKILEERAKEQEKIIDNMLLPTVFRSICFWLGNHPLRILIPVAVIINLALHGAIGPEYDEFILKIFGKL